MDGRHSLHLGKRCPPFREKELGSALLDVPSTKCLLYLMLISHPSAEDCEDLDHFPRAVDVVQPAATTEHSAGHHPGGATTLGE